MHARTVSGFSVLFVTAGRIRALRHARPSPPQVWFSAGQGESLWRLCRGLDDRKLDPVTPEPKAQKSIGVEVCPILLRRMHCRSHILLRAVVGSWYALSRVASCSARFLSVEAFAVVSTRNLIDSMSVEQVFLDPVPPCAWCR